jgi:undecaprenyl-diphosphatase
VTAGPRRLEERPLLRRHPVAFRLSLVLWVLGGLVFFALAVDPVAEAVEAVDERVHELAVDLETPVVVGFAKALDFIGSTWVTAPVMVIVGLYLIYRRRWEALSSWVLAMIGSQLLIGPMKNLYERARPPMALVETTGYSFPSGHAVAGAAIAVALVIVLVPAGPKRRNLEMLAAAFAVFMALSRVYLRAHWLSDVAGGAALGAAVAIGAAALVHWIDERRETAAGTERLAG